MRRRRRAPTPASILQPTLSSPTNPPYPLLKNNSYNNHTQPQQPPPHPATIAKDHLILPPTHPIKSYTPLSSLKRQPLPQQQTTTTTTPPHPETIAKAHLILPTTQPILAQTQSLSSPITAYPLLQIPLSSPTNLPCPIPKNRPARQPWPPPPPAPVRPPRRLPRTARGISR